MRKLAHSEEQFADIGIRDVPDRFNAFNSFDYHNDVFDRFIYAKDYGKLRRRPLVTFDVLQFPFKR